MAIPPHNASVSPPAIAAGGRPGFMPAAPHPREQERIDSLHALHVLDSEHEKRYDDLTRLVADIFDVPICLVSLVDENRQWFKAHCGIDARETGRDLAFCAHALHEERYLVVNDASKDERFHDNPLVTGPPYLRFYAGALLRDSSGLPLGTLCLIDHTPRELSAPQLERLGRCATLVENELVQRDSLLTERTRATLQASIDPITGYSTRRRYLQTFAHWMESRGSESYQAIMLKVSEAEHWRHHQGEVFLQEAMQSLSSQINESFDDEDVIKGRLCSDTLIILLPQRQSVSGMRWQRFITQPWLMHLSSALRPKLLVATATFTPEGTTAHELVELLEEELASAAHWAPCQQNLQVADLSSNVTLAIALGDRFARALRDNELSLHAQPILDVRTRKVCGMEMLLRWQVQGRWVTANQMLRMAERAGLGEELDTWVLRQTCAMVSRWQSQRSTESLGVPVSLNLSAKRLIDSEYAETLRRILRLNRLKGEHLRLDLTGCERFAETPEAMIAAMTSLTRDGVSFCIDRFGRENANLRLLSRMPAVAVKLHPRFMAPQQHEPDQTRLIKAWTCAMKTLGLVPIAVGSKRVQQLSELESLGFDQVQSDAFGQPALPEDSYAQWLAETHSSLNKRL